jgi:tRNA modification GTPase
LLVTRQVFERLLECGARTAEPGEFTRRAFLNGKMDLTQAEAVMDLISARTDMALRAARVQMEGRLGAKTEALRAELLELVAELEAYIDFPDEDIDPEVGQGMVKRLDAVTGRLDSLAATAEHGRMLREGVRTVIFGEPNVGKSSLLNRLAGYDRAIVHAEAGTTRDTIEESVDIGGIALLLTDTAGVRTAGGEVERQGVERTRRALETADLVIEVVDASNPPGLRLDAGDLAARPHVLALNKCDLGIHAAWRETGGVEVCCLTGQGIETLAKRIIEVLEFGPGDWGADAVAVNARHKACLRAASEAARRARDLLAAGDAPEFVSIELREALDQVAAIAGRVDTEEILGSIFGKFCIGK